MFHTVNQKNPKMNKVKGTEQSAGGSTRKKKLETQESVNTSQS
jgi:hypothetical protein